MKEGLRHLLPVVILFLLAGPVIAEIRTGEDGTIYETDSSFSRLLQTKLGDSLIPKLGRTEKIPVIISLVNQPTFQISQELQAKYWDELRANEAEIRAIHQKYSTGRRPSSPEEAAKLARAEFDAVTPEDRTRVRRLNERSKELKDKMRKEISERSRSAVAVEQEIVSQWIISTGGSVTYSYDIENAISARVSGTALRAVANHPAVRYIVEDELRGADLDVSVPTISAATFWNAGETGGYWWNATCDTGVDTSHPALSGKTWWQGVFHATAVGWSGYGDNSTSTDDLQGHGTHVAGIANSTDTTYRGVSYGSTQSTNLKAGFRATDGRGWMYDSDGMAAVHWGFSNATMDAINLSFGGETTEDDNGYVRFWDAVVDARNTIAVISAGNDGPNEGTLGSPGIFWNGLCVANVNDQNTTNRADDVISGSSSRGPTVNNRKKPDIAAPGSGILATNNNWEGTSSDFVSKSGTSMAAPHVAGAATLLHDAGLHDPRSIKAVLINTADYIQGNTTWSKEYGWGYINLNTAYLRRTNVFLTSVKPQGSPGWYKLYKVSSPQIGDKATMVWNRHVNYNNASYPTTYYALNDLNLRFYVESTNASHSTSLSGPDNVEQVVSSTTSPLVIRAYAWSTSFNAVSAETFALAVPPGTVAAGGPVLQPESSSTSYAPPLNSKFRVSVRLTNSGDLAAHNCNLTVTLPAGVSLVSGTLSNSVGTIAAGSSSAWIDLWLKTTTTGTKTVTLSASSNSYGITDWSGSGSFTINPGPADTVSPYSTLSVGGPAYQTGGTDKIANGGFESGTAGWVTSGTTAIESTAPYSGSSNLKLGPGTGSAYQSVSISSGASRVFLTFWYKSDAGILRTGGCSIQDSLGSVLVYPFYSSWNQPVWTKVTVDVSRFKGQTIRVNFYSSGGFFGNATLWLDEVTLKENETIWVKPANLHSISAADSNAGLDYTQFAFNVEPWSNYSAPFSMTGKNDGWNNLYYRSVDNGGNIEPSISTGLFLDSEAPRSILYFSGARAFSGGTERVTNGGFESGLTGWTTSGAVSAVSSPVYAGAGAAKIGGSGGGSLYQDVAIQGGASRAIVSVRLKAVAGTGSTYNAVYLMDPSTGLSSYSMGWNYTHDWIEYTWDVTRYKGSTIRLRFDASFTSGTPSTLYVDQVMVRQDSNLSILPTTIAYIYSAERCGVKLYESKIDSGSYVAGQSFSVPTPGLHTVRYRALDNLDHQESDVVTQVNVDNTGPTGSIVINGGAASTTSPNVSLTLSATDPAGVTEMRIQSDTGVWGAWQAYQSPLVYSFTSTTAGTKTLSVQYRDGVGNVSPAYSDSINYSPPVDMSIPNAKKQADGQGISLTQKVVTAIFPTKGYFYIEEPDRTAGIRVRSSILPTGINRSVSITGVPATVYAEREIVLNTISEHGPASEIKPVGMPNNKLGGAAFHYQPGIPGTEGLNNIGLLVKSWGRVTRVVGSSFYIDDGSGVMDSYPPVGVLVQSGNVGVTPPMVGQYVEVTGISGAETLGGVPIRVLRPRNAEDIRIRQFAAAFVYDSQPAEAQSFKSLLDSQGAVVDLIAYSDIERTDWSKYHLVLIGADTGSWTDPAKVSAVVGANTSIIGIGSGGTRFLDAVTTPNLFIGWLQSASTGTMSGTVFGGDIYTFPYNLGVAPGSVLSLYTTSTYTVELFDPNGASSRILQDPASANYFPVASEADRFYQWGYSGSPSIMTKTGKDLFTNLVFRAARP